VTGDPGPWLERNSLILWADGTDFYARQNGATAINGVTIPSSSTSSGAGILGSRGTSLFWQMNLYALIILDRDISQDEADGIDTYFTHFTEIFDSSTTWTVPEGVYEVTVEAWGAGGSGGSA